MADEIGEVLAFLAEIFPADPADLVVLAIGVVVAVLRVADFVAGQHQRRALRQQQAGELVLAQLAPQRGDRGIVGRAFMAAIVAVIVAGAVAIVLAVGLVVLFVVAEQIRQRETVMDGDVVDAGARRAVVMVEQVGGGRSCGSIFRRSGCLRRSSSAAWRCDSGRSIPTIATGTRRPDSRPCRGPTARRPA